MTDAELTIAELNAYADVDELRIEMARRIAELLGMPGPRHFTGWTKSRGWARGTVYSLPRWAIEPRVHLLDYIAHELAHLPFLDHGPALKRREANVLKSFGIGVTFGRVYMRELYDLETGAVLFRSWREERRQKAAGETSS